MRSHAEAAWIHTINNVFEWSATTNQYQVLPTDQLYPYPETFLSWWDSSPPGWRLTARFDEDKVTHKLWLSQSPYLKSMNSYWGFWTNTWDSALDDHRWNFWKNPVHHSSALPVLYRIHEKLHWSCSGNFSWHNILIRQLILALGASQQKGPVMFSFLTNQQWKKCQILLAWVDCVKLEGRTVCGKLFNWHCSFADRIFSTIVFAFVMWNQQSCPFRGIQITW